MTILSITALTIVGGVTLAVGIVGILYYGLHEIRKQLNNITGDKPHLVSPKKKNKVHA